jgi:hypothetical protein
MRNFSRWLLPMLVTASAHATDDGSIVRWEWTCASKVYYAMKVSPNGNYKPIAEASPTTLKIQVKRMKDGWYLADVCPKKLDFLEVEEPGGLFSTGMSNPCFQTVNFRFAPLQSPDTPAELEEVHASIEPTITKNMALDVERDDIEWRFVLSSTDLTTTRRSRQLRVSSPRFEFAPEADVHFFTGECVLDKHPPH